MTDIVIEKKSSKHIYEIGTVIDGEITSIGVEANTNTQAASIAKKNGYTVRDVNMVG